MFSVGIYELHCICTAYLCLRCFLDRLSYMYLNDAITNDNSKSFLDRLSYMYLNDVITNDNSKSFLGRLSYMYLNDVITNENSKSFLGILSYMYLKEVISTTSLPLLIFQDLPRGLTKPYTMSQKPEFASKNRYKGVYPCKFHLQHSLFLLEG